MQNPLSTHDSALEELTAHIADLERRISILELQQPGIPKSAPPAMRALPSDHPLEGFSSSASGSLAAIGKGFLGIAGAYLLRALAEAGTLPQLAVVIVAFAYAALWLAWAARAHARKFESAVYAATAALTFSPMVWELTLRFKVLPPGTAAGALLGFVLLVACLAWKRRLTGLAWAATSPAVITTIVLLVATRYPAPFVLAVLLMGVVTEFAKLHDRWRGLSIVVALLADLAVIVLIAVYPSQTNIASVYKPIGTFTLLALTSGLFVVYGGCTIVSTIVLGRTISGFDVGQVVATFIIAFVHAIRVTEYPALLSVAVFCLAAGLGCYWAAFSRFDNRPRGRNYHVFASWAAALLLAGTFCFSSQAAQSLSFGLLAVLAAFAATRLDRWTLRLHAAVYLGAAGLCSQLWVYAAHSLVGPWPPPPHWAAWVTAVAAVSCCAVLWRAPEETGPQADTRRKSSVLRLIFALFIAYLGAASLVSGIVWLLPSDVGLSLPILAMLRTLVVCAMILVSSFVGSRWNYVELTRIAYGTIGFCVLKLLVEDFRVGTPGSLAVSLLFYGSVFVLVPRLGRAKRAVFRA